MPALAALIRQIFGGVVMSGIFAWMKKAFAFLVGRGAAGAGGSRGLLGKIYSFFFAFFAAQEFLLVITNGIKRLIGWIGVGGAVISGGANINQVWHLLENIADPQAAVMDWLSDALAALPSLNDLIAHADGLISSMTVFQYISPAPTFTIMLQITGVGWAFNQLLMAAIQNMIFIFSVFIVRWAFATNFTFTKSINRRAKT